MDYWKWHSDIKMLACDTELLCLPWMGSLPVGGGGEQDVAHFVLRNYLGRGQLSCVCVLLD